MDFCLRQALDRRRGEGPPRLLEPSAGDGNFLRGVLRHADEQGLSEVCVVAVERDAGAAAACAEVAERLGAKLVHDSFFAWAEADRGPIDLLVGNPPFVRYQLVPPEDRARAERLLEGLAGVSNLWLPFALLGLERLRPGGAFSLVLPAELLATVSAGQFREALLRGFEALTLTLFPRDTFAELLQDVLVVSGRKAAAPHFGLAPLRFEERGRAWTHAVPVGRAPWLRWLLSAPQLEAFNAATALPQAHALGALARLQVSTVTGANAFFTMDEATRRQHQLEPWCRPLLPRTAYAEGLIVRDVDHQALIEQGRRCWLADLRGPEPHAAARAWIAEGEAKGLHRRYKCRVREPWYRVPVVEPGALLLTKRAHQHHRLLRNAAGVLTTDTVYQGRMRASWGDQTDALVASFHSSLTLLSVEVEGRNYGGGVIELVPSEIARVQVLLAPLSEALPQLDALSRAHGGQRDEADTLADATDALLAEAVPGYRALQPTLREARCALRARRFAR